MTGPRKRDLTERQTGWALVLLGLVLALMVSLGGLALTSLLSGGAGP